MCGLFLSNVSLCEVIHIDRTGSGPDRTKSPSTLIKEWYDCLLIDYDSSSNWANLARVGNNSFGTGFWTLKQELS
jgi:hypothetical protein